MVGNRSDLRASFAAAVAGAGEARRADAAVGRAGDFSTLTCGAFDVSRAVDADRAADHPLRRPWWAVAAIHTRPLASAAASHELCSGPTLVRRQRRVRCLPLTAWRLSGCAAIRRRGQTLGAPTEAAVEGGVVDWRAAS